MWCERVDHTSIRCVIGFVIGLHSMSLSMCCSGFFANSFVRYNQTHCALSIHNDLPHLDLLMFEHGHYVCEAI